MGRARHPRASALGRASDLSSNWWPCRGWRTCVDAADVSAGRDSWRHSGPVDGAATATLRLDQALPPPRLKCWRWDFTGPVNDAGRFALLKDSAVARSPPKPSPPNYEDKSKD